VHLNSVDSLCVTKLDVLDGLDTIRICIDYRLKDENFSFAQVDPGSAVAMEALEPVYVDMPGWKQPTTGARRLEDLPAEARAYLERIEDLVETRIDIISTGPDRDETIILKHPFGD
jgi:adenylosuccinate synthase